MLQISFQFTVHSLVDYSSNTVYCVTVFNLNYNFVRSEMFHNSSAQLLFNLRFRKDSMAKVFVFFTIVVYLCRS